MKTFQSKVVNNTVERVPGGIVFAAYRHVEFQTDARRKPYKGTEVVLSIRPVQHLP